jgi:glutamate-1-semialdehyde 2,1-aminomutase
MVAGLAVMRALDHAALEGLERSIATRDAPMYVSAAASLFRIHPLRRIPNDYREAYPAPAGAILMKPVTRFFAENGIVLSNGAAASLSTPMEHADAAFIIGVFNGFLDTHGDQLDEVRS